VYVTNATLTAASTLSVNNCFSSAYDNYRIVVTDVSPSTQTDVRLSFSTGGTINSTPNYCMSNTFISGASISVNEELNQTSFRFIFTGASSNSVAWLEMVNPFGSGNTNVLEQGFGIVGGGITNRGFVGFFNGSTSFDGFKITVASGTVSAKINVFGYRKA
jgi:hypothetical protein